MCISLLFFFFLIYLLWLSRRLCCVCLLVCFFFFPFLIVGGWLTRYVKHASCFLFLLLLLFACLCYPYCVLLFYRFRHNALSLILQARVSIIVWSPFCFNKRMRRSSFLSLFFFFVCVRAFKCLVVSIQRKEKRMACRFFLWMEKSSFFFFVVVVVCLSWERDWGRVRKEAVERVRDEGQYVSVNGTRKQTKL